MDLFSGADPSTIGNSCPPLLPAPKAAQGAPGLGQPRTVVKFQPSGIGGYRTSNVTEKQEGDTRVLTVGIYATPNPSNSNGGPITGIALFGSGASGTIQVEFDIPVVTGNEDTFPSSFPPFSGGVQISVPATSVEIRARNDASFIPPQTQTAPAQTTAIGLASQTPITVTAAIAAGTKPTYARAFRTVWLSFTPGAPFFAPGNVAACLIPPFATSVRVVRAATGALPAINPPGEITVMLANSVGTSLDTVVVPVGTSCPEIPISGQAGTLFVRNTDAAISDVAVAAVFTLGI